MCYMKAKQNCSRLCINWFRNLVWFDLKIVVWVVGIVDISYSTIWKDVPTNVAIFELFALVCQIGFIDRIANIQTFSTINATFGVGFNTITFNCAHVPIVVVLPRFTTHMFVTVFSNATFVFESEVSIVFHTFEYKPIALESFMGIQSFTLFGQTTFHGQHTVRTDVPIPTSFTGGSFLDTAWTSFGCWRDRYGHAVRNGTDGENGEN